MAHVSNRWKLGIALLPILGSLAGLAGFSSPPFDSGPAQTLPMAWQCYSALVERAAAACGDSPAIPYPANTALRLAQYKALASNLLTAVVWLETNQPVSETNRLTPASILPKAGVAGWFWTNTPIVGTGTDTNAWHGLRKVLTNMQWTATPGANLCGTNLFLYSLGHFRDCLPNVWYSFGCSIATAEAGFAWAASDAIPGLEEQFNGLAGAVRWVDATGTTDVTYKVRHTLELWSILDYTNGAPCPTNYPPDGWISLTLSVTTSYVCNATAGGTWGCEGSSETNLIETNYQKREIVDTITDPCDPNFVCARPYQVWSAAKSAFISFAVCSTAPLYEAQEWFQGVAPTTCNSTGAIFQADATLSYPLSNGWTLAHTTTGAVTDLCITNYATATNIPFAGSTSTNPIGWRIERALLVRKWIFDY